MSQVQSQVSRLAENHYQVRVSCGYSVIDVRVNNDHDAAQRAAKYLAGGLDGVLSGLNLAIASSSE